MMASPQPELDWEEEEGEEPLFADDVEDEDDEDPPPLPPPMPSLSQLAQVHPHPTTTTTTTTTGPDVGARGTAPAATGGVRGNFCFKKISCGLLNVSFCLNCVCVRVHVSLYIF